MVIGNPHAGIQTQTFSKPIVTTLYFISQIESKNVDEALHEERWVIAIRDTLNQFYRNKVWHLVPKPKIIL